MVKMMSVGVRHILYQDVSERRMQVSEARLKLACVFFCGYRYFIARYQLSPGVCAQLRGALW